MSVISLPHNKFSFTNPSVRQILPVRLGSRPRSSTIGDAPRPRSASKRGCGNGSHDNPLMGRTMSRRMVRSAPCLPRTGGRKGGGKPGLANGLKSVGGNVKSKPRPKSRMPATRTSAKRGNISVGHIKTVDHSFKAPEADKPAFQPPEHVLAAAIMAPVKAQKLAKQWAAKAKTKPRAPSKTHKTAAHGHQGVNTAEHVYSFKEPEDKPEDEIQNTVAGAALTSNTPTALSSHMDPRLLQAASGIQGAGLMGAQMSQMSGTDSDIPMDGEQTPNSADPTRFDAGALATHPEQIGEGGQEEYEEERIPSDPMRVKLIDAPADQVDGSPVAQQPIHPPTLLLPPQASSAPPPEDLSSVPPSPGPMSPAMAPQLSVHPQQVPQLGGPPPQDPQFGGPPPQQMSAPAYSYESYESSPYGENLYNQQPGYDPLQEQYHMNAPLLDQGNPEHMFYQQQQQFPNNYPQNHKSYYHMQNPERYNFTKAVQNYDREAQNDGMYCYSCVMFFGVLMIGVGIIMIIVELFDLFGRHKNMPLAIAGGGALALGIIILASAMLLWRRRRSNIKKKAAHV